MGREHRPHGGGPSAEDVKTVFAIGSSALNAGDSQASRDAAIDSGLKAAVGSALMASLPQETLAGHFQTISESVLSRTDEFVRDYKVVSQSRHDKTFRVLIQASIFNARLAETLKSLGIGLDEQRAPRIALLIAEKKLQDINYTYWWGGLTDGASSLSVETIAARLSDKGLKVVETQAGPQTQSYPAELGGPEALALARMLGADIAVVGLAQVEPAANTMTGSIQSFRAEVDVRIFKVDNAELMGQVQRTTLAAGDDAEAAARESLQNAAGLAGEDLAARITASAAAMKPGAGKIDLRIEGTGGNIAALVKFRGALNSMSGVDSVQLKEMQPDAAILSVDYQGTAQALADALLLQGFNTFGIDITEVAVNTIHLRLVQR